MATKKVITSIEIELKNYEPIKFTMDEAEELYEQLHTIFGTKTVTQYIPWWNRPYYYYGTSTSSTATNALIRDAAIKSPSDFADWITAAGNSVSSENTGMTVNYEVTDVGNA